MVCFVVHLAHLCPADCLLVKPREARGKKKDEDNSDEEEEEESEEESEEEESEEEEAGTGTGSAPQPVLSRAERKQMKKDKKNQAQKDEEDEEDEDQDPLLANPNTAVGKKMNLSSLSAPRELSRRERFVQSLLANGIHLISHIEMRRLPRRLKINTGR
jgi:hypothetical protein